MWPKRQNQDSERLGVTDWRYIPCLVVNCVPDVMNCTFHHAGNLLLPQVASSR